MVSKKIAGMLVILALAMTPGVQAWETDQLNNSESSYNLTFNVSPLTYLVWIDIPRNINVTSSSIALEGHQTSEMWPDANSTSCWGSFHASAPCVNAYDNSDLNYAVTVNQWTEAGVLMNYTKPSNAIGGGINFYTTADSGVYSVPSSCFGQSPLQFNWTSYWRSDVRSYKWCYDGSTQTLIDSDIGATAQYYELRENYFYWYVYPENITFDVGNDGSNEFTNLTLFNKSETFDPNITAINNFLQNECTADWLSGTCHVPINVSVSLGEILEITNISISGDEYPSIGNCSDPVYQEILNFTFADEETLDALTGSSEYTLTMTWNNSENSETFNGSVNNVSSFAVCTLNGSYTADLFLSYDQAGYGTRFYFLDQADLDNSTHSVTLYLLNESSGDIEYFETQDQTGYPLGDVYVQMQRYYISQNLYRVVAMMKSDDRGRGLSFIDRENVWYKFSLSKDGSVLRIIGPSQVSETTSDEPYPLSTASGELITWADYDAGVVRTCEVQTATNFVVCDVVDPTGVADEYCLKVERFNILNISDFDEQCSSGSSMTLMVNVTDVADENGTIRYTLYAVGDHILAQADYTFGTIIPYGFWGVFLSIIMFVVGSTLGRWNPAVCIGFGILSLVMAVGLMFLVVPMIGLASIIFVGAIIAYMVKT